MVLKTGDYEKSKSQTPVLIDSQVLPGYHHVGKELKKFNWDVTLSQQ